MNNIIHVNGVRPELARPPRHRRNQSFKYYVAMKLFLAILILNLNVTAAVYSQRINLAVKDKPFIDVLTSIREQTDYYFMFPAEMIANAKTVTLTLKNATIEESLQKLCENQPFGYLIKDKAILLRIMSKDVPNNVIGKREGLLDITGVVTDENSSPLSGVTVILKEQTNRITMTDDKGRFIFTKAPENGTLIFRMIGHETRQLDYVNGNIPGVKLRTVNVKMEEVQIIAYGEVKKKFVTSNINGVKGDIIAKSPVTNLLYALEGRVPGLLIQQNSGISGNGVYVRVQGENSIGNGNLPFYVIDGVPYSPEAINTNVRNITSGAGSTLGFINPSEIESVEVLKDADATAIYGSRAANGAILITTKKGKAGKTRINLNLQNGWGQVANKIDVLNTQQYVALRKEAYANANITPNAAQYDINGTWDQSRNTDWQDVLIGGTAQYQNMQASISGGSENTQFLAGGTFLRETTVFPGKFSDIKGGAHFNLNHTSSNKKLNFSLTVNYMQDRNRLPQTDLTDVAIRTSPVAPALYNPDGTINWSPLPSNPNVFTFSNPIARLIPRYEEKTNNLISNSQVSYEIIPDLHLKVGMGYNRLQTNETATTPLAAVKPDERPFSQRNASFANKSIETWILEPQLTYKKKFSYGYLDALIGGTFQQTRNYMQSYFAQGFANDAQLADVMAAPNLTATGSLQSTYRYSAIFGRIGYRYMDKYILNLTARRDGSSRFGSANLFHSFYSAGAAWIFSEENFVKQQLPFLNMGKLRLSYGTTGNDQIGEYKFLDLYNNYAVDVPYQQVVSLTAVGLPNPYLQWEETRKLNVGVDLGFFNNRVTFTGNFYRNRSSNQLLGENTSTVTGFPNIVRNLRATVQNRGWEFVLEGTILDGKKFSWISAVNLTIPRNKLLQYDNLTNNTFIVGKSLNLFKAYEFVNVNPETGLYQFRTSKGDLTSTPNSQTDKTVILDMNPQLYGGFSNTITFGNWNVDFLFQYVNRKGRNFRYQLYPGASFDVNSNTEVLNHWKTQGDNSNVQKISSTLAPIRQSATAMLSSNATYSDASFARLKNASISYTLPRKLLDRLNITQARVYAQGQNLLTFTNYYGLDPETVSNSSLPPLRVYTLGIQLTF